MRFPIIACLAALALCGPAGAAGVRGTAFGPGDQPLPGVRVTLSGSEGVSLEAFTDAAGRYGFDNLRPGRYTVVAGKAGFASQRQPVALTGPAQVLGVSFRLKPWSAIPWSITGTVLGEEDGRPIAGANVTLTREVMPGRSDTAGTTTTDDAGFYAFTGLKAGRYALSVAAARRLPARRDDVVLLRESDRPAVEIRLAVPPKEQIPGSVEIEVLGTDGQPLAGAEVQVTIAGEGTYTPLLWGDELENRQWREQRVNDGRMTMRIRATGATDAAGRVRFTLPAGTWRIGVAGKGVVAPAQQVVVPPDGEVQPAAYRMAEGEEPPEAEPQRVPAQQPPQGKLRGVVLKPDGTPLADCGIYLFTANPRAGGAPWDNEHGGIVQAYTTTNARGIFERNAIPAGEVLVAVKTRGYSETEPVAAQVPADGAAEVTLRLPGPSLAAAGRVTDGEGKPLSGARVYAHRLLGGWRDSNFWQSVENLWLDGQQQDGGPWPFDTPLDDLKPGVIPGLLRHGVSYTETDAEGRFALPELDAATYHFGAAATGRCKVVREKVLLGADAPVLDFALPALGGIEGVVTRPDGQPAAGVGVSFGYSRQGDPRGRWEEKRVAAGPDGRYRLDGLEPGTYQVRATVAGYPAVALPGVAVKEAHSTPGADIRLEEGVALRGRVLKPDGTPAVGASVTFSILRNGPPDTASATADAEGAFALTGLGRGTGACTAKLEPFAPARAQVTLPQQAGAALEIRLMAAATIRGTLRDEEGKPLADAWVSWYPMPPTDTSYEGRQPARTDADGAFALTGIPAGTLQIYANKEGYRYVSETREVAAGAEVKLEFTMARLRLGSLRGRLLRPDGKPAAGITVRAYTEGASQVTAFTDAEGAFRFPHVASGKVHLNPEARLLAGQPSTFEVKPKEETAAPDLKLCEAGDVECVLKGLPAATGPAPLMLIALAEAQSPDGQAVPASAAVRLYIRGGGRVPADPGAAPVPAGVTGVLLYSAGGMVHTLYPPGTTVAFNLFNAPGPPSAPVAGETTTLRQVPVGRCRVGVVLPRSGDGMVLLPGPSVSVAAGQTARAEITIAPGGKLSGRLPPAPATGGRGESQVWLFRRETLDLAGMAMARADGTFSLDGLAPGDYLAAVWLPGHAGVWQPFTIRAGETTEVALAPAKGVPLRGRVEGERPKGILVCAESETSFDAGQVADDGTFAIEHLTPGAYTLRLWTPGKEKVVTRAGVQIGENGAEGVMVKWQ